MFLQSANLPQDTVRGGPHSLMSGTQQGEGLPPKGIKSLRTEILIPYLTPQYGPDAFGKELESQATRLGLGCGWSKPFLKPTQAAQLFLALWLALWIQGKVLKRGVGGSTASPISSPGRMN